MNYMPENRMTTFVYEVGDKVVTPEDFNGIVVARQPNNWIDVNVYKVEFGRDGTRARLIFREDQLRPPHPLIQLAEQAE